MACFHGVDVIDGNTDGIDWCFATEAECEPLREANAQFAMTTDGHCTANP
jgi:hypothetical protein